MDAQASIAAQLMSDHDCTSLLVVDQSDRVCGSVTDRDLCMSALLQESALHTFPVWRAMSRSLQYLKVDESVFKALTMMRRHKIRELPVLDAEHRLLGFLPMADVLYAIGRDRDPPRVVFASAATVPSGESSSPKTELHAGDIQDDRGPRGEPRFRH